MSNAQDEAERQDAAQALLESERRYLTLFETMAHGVVWQDHAGRITSVNAAAQRMLGMTLEQLQNMSKLDPSRAGVHEDGSPFRDEDRPSILALQTGRPVRNVLLGFQHPTLPGTRWLRIDATPELDPAGGPPLGVYSVLEDITDRVRAEREATEAARTVTTILENVTDAFFAINKEWRYTYVNRRGEEVSGHTSEQLIGRSIWDIYPDIIDTMFDEQFHNVMNGGDPVTFEALYTASQTWYRAHVYPTPDGIAFYLRNIMHERRAAEERQSAEIRQREFMRDVLASVTNGKLRLCFREADLPGAPPRAERITLTPEQGLRRLRQVAEEAARAEGFADERCHDLVTAASEAGMNAVVHAGGGAAYVGVLPEKIVQIWIVDEGPGISMENLPRAALQKGYTTAGTLGHGMKMMLRAVDRVFLRTSPSGATVVLEQEPVPKPSLLLNDW
ncbi:PAS domain S-box protein [Capsulimonas corticalis]|uniref:PAS domain S-box protein n=1 Tax=Capsulimonas corticalis TaxID=2219043 RepID=UPI0014030D5C|nr:PAS domain S-box protein [Capsulimonas corticalis]